MYKVLYNFTDSHDKGWTYAAGDVYPRPGYTPSPTRVAELLSSTNRLGKSMIAEDTDEEDTPKRRRRKAGDE